MSKPDIEEAVRRLDVSDDFKSWAAFTEPDGARIPCLMARAPDLRALIASWRERGEALRPFADAANDWPTPAEWEAECEADGHIISFPAEDKDSLDDWKHTLTVGDCRRARAALGPEPKAASEGDGK